MEVYRVPKARLTEEEERLAGILVDVLLKKKAVSDIPGWDKGVRKEFREKIVEKYGETFVFSLPDFDRLASLKEDLSVFLSRHFPSINIPGIVEEVVRGVSYGILLPLLQDPDLEEIMVNGPKKEIFVFHRRKGMMRTGEGMGKGEIREFLRRVERTVGKKMEGGVLDAYLPDGSRINAISSNLVPGGPAITIRKFSSRSITMGDLMREGVVSGELAAFLWFAVEGMGLYPLNLLVCGGAGAGKTTTLNVLTDFITPEERVITIEDTLELDIVGKENWVQMVTRRDADMDFLLRNALRMRPDRIIVGEVRGPEARTLFTAMDVGHRGVMGTLHANNSREALVRLKTPPMNVPESLLPLLNLIIVQHRFRRGRGVVRRVVQVTEVVRMEEKVLLNDLFVYDPREDVIKKTEVPPHVLDLFSEVTGISKEEVAEDIERRRRVLEWVEEKGVKREDAVKLFSLYAKDPERVVEEVGR